MTLTVRIAENVSVAQSDMLTWAIEWDIKTGIVDRLNIAEHVRGMNMSLHVRAANLQLTHGSKIGDWFKEAYPI